LRFRDAEQTGGASEESGNTAALHEASSSSSSSSSSGSDTEGGIDPFGDGNPPDPPSLSSPTQESAISGSVASTDAAAEAAQPMISSSAPTVQQQLELGLGSAPILQSRKEAEVPKSTQFQTMFIVYAMHLFRKPTTILSVTNLIF
jgi:hypothetical protein